MSSAVSGKVSEFRIKSEDLPYASNVFDEDEKA